MKEEIVSLVKRFSKEILIALVFAVIVAVVFENISEKTGEEILDHNVEAVATVIAYDKDGKPLSQGSGFFINSEGVLVTAYHVVEGADSITAKLSSGAYYNVKGVIGADKNFDIAVIQFEAQKTPFVKIGDSDKIKIGEKVFAIGTPMGLESTVSEGIISNPKIRLDGIELIQFSAPISSGSSGGALFNAHGKVVGVTTGSLEDSQQEENTVQNLNFAIPVNLIEKAIQGKGELVEGSPGYFYSLGVIAKNKREYDKAIEYYKKVMSLDDKYLDAYLDLGIIYYDQGQYDLEVENFLKATQLDQNNYDAYFYLGTAYEDKGLYDEAIVAYERALEIKPDDKDSLYYLSFLYILTGEKTKAFKLVPKLRELNPGLANEIKILLEVVK